MNQRIHGVLAPVVTPFKADLSPDSKRFIAHCKWLLSQSCGLAVFGTNSEANSLSMEERLNLLDELVAVLVVDLVAVAMPLVDHRLVVDVAHARRVGQLDRLRAEAHRAAEVLDFLLLG